MLSHHLQCATFLIGRDAYCECLLVHTDTGHYDRQQQSIH